MTNSRTAEVDAASMRIIDVYEENDWSSDTHLVQEFAALKTLLAQLTTAINRDKVESDLANKDELRDEKLRALYHLLNGLLYHPDEATKKAAQTVDKVFEKYGVAIAEENYSTESAMIESLLNDLAAEDLQTSIAALSGCAELIAALKTAQSDFETERVGYEQSKAQESTQQSAYKLKSEVLKQLNDRIIVYLRAMVQVDEPKYGELSRTLAIIINENNEVVKRMAKKAAEKPDSV